VSKIIYTAIFGNYEELKEPLVITPGWTYLCITDRPVESNVWEIHRLANVDDPIRLARRYKIKSVLPGRSIWVDASFTINCNLDEWFEKHFISPFTVIQHPFGKDAYEEGGRCIKSNKDAANVRLQLNEYRKEGLPSTGGVIQSGILMRENTDEVKEFCDLWFEQIKLSTRDQIGFAYAEWKLNKKWPRINYDYRKGQEFIFKTHYHRRK
jgi:hypothetical protein